MNRSILHPLFFRQQPNNRVHIPAVEPFSIGSVTLPLGMRFKGSCQSLVTGLSNLTRMLTSTKLPLKAQAADPAASLSLQPAHAGPQLRISASTLFYLNAFVEGGAVLAVELAGAKPFAALSGSSLLGGGHADVLANEPMLAEGTPVYKYDNLNLN